MNASPFTMAHASDSFIAARENVRNAERELCEHVERVATMRRPLNRGIGQLYAMWHIFDLAIGSRRVERGNTYDIQETTPNREGAKNDVLP